MNIYMDNYIQVNPITRGNVIFIVHMYDVAMRHTYILALPPPPRATSKENNQCTPRHSLHKYTKHTYITHLHAQHKILLLRLYGVWLMSKSQHTLHSILRNTIPRRAHSFTTGAVHPSSTCPPPPPVHTCASDAASLDEYTAPDAASSPTVVWSTPYWGSW